jgi:hypothetical protein
MLTSLTREVSGFLDDGPCEPGVPVRGDRYRLDALLIERYLSQTGFRRRFCGTWTDGPTRIEVAGNSLIHPWTHFEPEQLVLNKGRPLSCQFDEPRRRGEMRVSISGFPKLTLCRSTRGFSVICLTQDKDPRLVGRFPLNEASVELDLSLDDFDSLVVPLLFIIASGAVRRVRRMGVLLQYVNRPYIG